MTTLAFGATFGGYESHNTSTLICSFHTWNKELWTLTTTTTEASNQPPAMEKRKHLILLPLLLLLLPLERAIGQRWKDDWRPHVVFVVVFAAVQTAATWVWPARQPPARLSFELKNSSFCITTLLVDCFAFFLSNAHGNIMWFAGNDVKPPPAASF